MTTQITDQEINKLMTLPVISHIDDISNVEGRTFLEERDGFERWSVGEEESYWFCLECGEEGHPDDGCLSCGDGWEPEEDCC
ncbi:hypothetical protein [Ectothiorhodospira shaposhnikovii]|uniref:hypothetical protein n=1 Tax=Ectothiorhodospira shaposhnikovii TaxID=1054 RepID=UPI001EE863B1|nr:hypothetical protein [Ectothiorhodospira shaposhnikovii]MCG5512825.1 hypothetical protein [Ectothiorhodospira shaposhnikovii]